MTKEESLLKRIQTSKYFFLRLNKIEFDLKEKQKEFEKLLKEGRPLEYKKDVSFNEISIQKSKKNFSAEILFKDYEEKLNKLKLEIKKLKVLLNKNKILAFKLVFKVKDISEQCLLLCTFLTNQRKTEIRKNAGIKTNNEFDNILNKGLISFSYILENEFKKKRELKQNEE